MLKAILSFVSQKTGRSKMVANIMLLVTVLQSSLFRYQRRLLKAFLFRGSQSVFFAALFLVIAEIIRYGKLLQTESDETL